MSEDHGASRNQMGETCYRTENKISARALFDGRLKNYGISIHYENGPREKCLTDGNKNFLHVSVDYYGFVESMLEYHSCDGDPGKIIAAISKSCRTAVLSEHDPKYWGVNTIEERDAAIARDHQEFEAIFRKGATDADLERTMRDNYKWSYVARDPLGEVCAWGRGERDECVHEAIKSADAHAACDLVTKCETPEQVTLATTGPWILVLWPPRFDRDPRSWFLGDDEDMEDDEDDE